jgi:hypothetical protein
MKVQGFGHHHIPDVRVFFLQLVSEQVRKIGDHIGTGERSLMYEDAQRTEGGSSHEFVHGRILNTSCSSVARLSKWENGTCEEKMM